MTAAGGRRFYEIIDPPERPPARRLSVPDAVLFCYYHAL